MSERDVKPEAQGPGSSNAAVDAALSSRGGVSHGPAQLHDDPTSHAAADALGARAFTAGNQVFFGAGQQAAGTPQGDALLRHEMAHVEQARGVAAPQPGNYRVSDPGDHEERAAAGGGGGSAQPHTIYRDAHGGPAPAARGAGPVAHTNGDPYAHWKASINGNNHAQAVAQWQGLNADQRARLGHEPPAFIHKVIHTMKSAAAGPLRSSHVALDPYVHDIFASPEFDQFLVTLRTESLLTPFLRAEPHRGDVTQPRANKLEHWITAAASVGEARAIFQKVYPDLHDAAHPALPFGAHATAFGLEQIRRLYNVLTHFLPVGHVGTISGGFVLQNQDFGWFEPANFRVALPNHSGSRTAAADVADHGNHDMTGGGRSGSRKGYRKNGHRGRQTHVGHYTITALHEVGHGVGARMGGNDYATNAASYPGWTPLTNTQWAQGLWSAPTGHGDNHVPAAAKLDEARAREMMLHEIEHGAGSFHVDHVSHGDLVKWITTRYSNVPLYKWWKYIVVDGNAKDNAYRFEDMHARVRGDWAYALLTREGANPFIKLKANAFRHRVSWYSVSSRLEWFAEQYAHFYRTEKTGGGLIDHATLQLLHRLDHQSFHDSTGVHGGAGGHGGEGGGAEGAEGADNTPDASSEQAPQVGGSSGGGGAANREGAGNGAQAASPTRTEPLFFPW